ncbi:MAG: amidohydrolase [Pseudomonadota bacterium]
MRGFTRPRRFLRGAEAIAAAFLVTAPASAQETETAPASLEDAVAADYPYVEALYKYLHANPELSFKEEKTAARLAEELRGLGFTVTEKVGSAWTIAKARSNAGEVRDGVDGYGLVGVLENGPGPTLLIRTDMDALPLKEKTGVDYASTVVDVDYRGVEAPVMHACAHDTHMAIWVGVARRLVAMKDAWAGTLVMVAQPAEELGLGALAMIDDGLFTKFPRPDYNLALHTFGGLPAGQIYQTEGFALANVDSVDIFVRGVGGHGSRPHTAKDPIVIGAQIVNALQTLVSREVSALDSAVVTVGAFNAGFKHNIIPDEAHLQITVRSYKQSVREQLIAGIKRIAEAQARSAGVPEDKMPRVVVDADPLIATYNHPDLTRRIAATVTRELGDGAVSPREPIMGGEDFAYFGTQAPEIPSVMFFLGGTDPAEIAKYEKVGMKSPSNHSPLFAPDPEPTLTAGVRAMTAAALDLLTPERAPAPEGL